MCTLSLARGGEGVAQGKKALICVRFEADAGCLEHTHVVVAVCSYCDQGRDIENGGFRSYGATCAPEDTSRAILWCFATHSTAIPLHVHD